MLEINYQECELSVKEGSSISLSIEFRSIQNPFNVTLSPIDIAEVEERGLTMFVNSENIAGSNRATKGKMFQI